MKRTSAVFLCHLVASSTFADPKPALFSFIDILVSLLTSSFPLPHPRTTLPSTLKHNSCAIAQMKAERSGSLGNAAVFPAARRLCRENLLTGHRWKLCPTSIEVVVWAVAGSGIAFVCFWTWTGTVYLTQVTWLLELAFYRMIIPQLCLEIKNPVLVAVRVLSKICDCLRKLQNGVCCLLISLYDYLRTVCSGRVQERRKTAHLWIFCYFFVRENLFCNNCCVWWYIVKIVLIEAEPIKVVGTPGNPWLDVHCFALLFYYENDSGPSACLHILLPALT